MLCFLRTMVEILGVNHGEFWNKISSGRKPAYKSLMKMSDRGRVHYILWYSDARGELFEYKIVRHPRRSSSS
jgi:alpha-galactosidase/6-phospho-beta-glucosidase family protein